MDEPQFPATTDNLIEIGTTFLACFASYQGMVATRLLVKTFAPRSPGAVLKTPTIKEFFETHYKKALVMKLKKKYL
jgi:hypothetical protein